MNQRKNAPVVSDGRRYMIKEVFSHVCVYYMFRYMSTTGSGVE